MKTISKALTRSQPTRSGRQAVAHALTLPQARGLKFTTVIMTCVMLGCSEPAPEARLGEAGEALDNVSRNLDQIDKEIDSLRDDLDEKQDKRDKLVERKMSLEERVARRATDVALFRAVQSKLLNEEALKNSALSVEASDRVIVLSGKVTTQAERDIAVRLAASVAGVADVRSRLQVVAKQT